MNDVTDDEAQPQQRAQAQPQGHLALLPRPLPDPAVLAAITAAVELAWPEPAPPDEQDPVHQTWRFSGRWWNKPTPLRRERPWARR